MSKGKKKNDEGSMEPMVRFSDFIRLIISLPEDEQERMLDLMDEIWGSSMSIEDKTELFCRALLDATLGDIGLGDENDDDDDFEADDESSNYPHFLPRANVQKYTLRVTLKGIKPAIYRKFVVPSNITLRHLSELILDLMGWANYHLNQFRKGYDLYAPAYQREDDDSFLFSSVSYHNQEEYTLSDVLVDKGKSIVFEYDFGDSWEHEVRLSSIGEFEEDEPRITFVKGERACPPEDCGGIWGYQELLEIREKKAAKKRLTQEERERLEWYGLDSLTDEESSPEYFNNDFAEEICADFCD